MSSFYNVGVGLAVTVAEKVALLLLLLLLLLLFAVVVAVVLSLCRIANHLFYGRSPGDWLIRQDVLGAKPPDPLNVTLLHPLKGDASALEPLVARGQDGVPGQLGGGGIEGSQRADLGHLFFKKKCDTAPRFTDKCEAFFARYFFAKQRACCRGGKIDGERCSVRPSQTLQFGSLLD